MMTYTTTSADTWNMWTTSSSTTTVGSGNTVWYTWVGTGNTTTAGSACTTDVTWKLWTTTPANISTGTVTYSTAWGNWVDAQELTAEQKAEQERRNAEYAAEQERYAAQRKQLEDERQAAAEKAEKLLKEHLNEEEKARYERAGYFLVKSHKGNLYKVKKGTHGNVIRLDPVTNEELERLCVQPSGVPTADANLAQKLWIEHMEDEFRKIANITKLPREARVTDPLAVPA